MRPTDTLLKMYEHALLPVKEICVQNTAVLKLLQWPPTAPESNTRNPAVVGRDLDE